jgi:hypothetical protein
MQRHQRTVPPAKRRTYDERLRGILAIDPAAYRKFKRAVFCQKLPDYYQNVACNDILCNIWAAGAVAGRMATDPRGRVSAHRIYCEGAAL